MLRPPILLPVLHHWRGSTRGRNPRRERSSPHSLRRNVTSKQNLNVFALSRHLGRCMQHHTPSQEPNLPLPTMSRPTFITAYSQFAMQRPNGARGMHFTASPMATREIELVQHLLGLRESKNFNIQFADPVFICIDCEAFEHAQHKITEIGVAVLDSRDVKHLTAHDTLEQWNTNVKCAHFRPIEYAKLRNKTFIKGCADSFNFGRTMWIKLADAKEILRRIFQDPNRLDACADVNNPAQTTNPRNVVFLAHGASNDSEYLRRLHFDLRRDASVARTIDTQILAGRSKHRMISLQRLLHGLGIDAVNLHNAGNDAAYTLQAMLRIALLEMQNPGSVIAGLESMVGKLPALEYDQRVAPVIYGGTAVEDDGGDEEEEEDQAVHHSMARRQDPKSRREHKEAVRAARNRGKDNLQGAPEQKSQIPGHVVTR